MDVWMSGYPTKHHHRHGTQDVHCRSASRASRVLTVLQSGRAGWLDGHLSGARDSPTHPSFAVSLVDPGQCKCGFAAVETPPLSICRHTYLWMLCFQQNRTELSASLEPRRPSPHGLWYVHRLTLSSSRRGWPAGGVGCVIPMQPVRQSMPSQSAAGWRQR